MTTAPDVPVDFVAEADQAVQHNDRAHLILLQLELDQMPWQEAGMAMIDRCLAQLHAPAAADRVVLFTGHRIDSPGRSTPRFPPQAEAMARDAIALALQKEIQNGTVTGIAGGANGGDILFLEVCHQLGIPFQMLLALPEPQFIKASVKAPAGNWTQRFHTLARESNPRVMAASQNLPAWLAHKRDYDFWARNNLWLVSNALALQPKAFVLLALWDGQSGDGPGGTENMVKIAQQHGANFIHLDTRKLFAGIEIIRTAKP